MSAFIRTIGEVFASTRKDRNAASMPLRVLEAISKNDELSEVLVKLIQILIFGTFGILYLVSPSSNTELSSQVPLVVSIYLVFSVIGLGFAIYRIMPAWAVYASIIVDIVLLTYLIWSFHIQYMQDASFSLKSPSFAFYFILIGVRTLRFQARYVAAAGASAILCWLALMGYVVFSDPSNPMITRDYITYLTSNSVLIGAEVEKMVALGVFTILLVVAVRRAHSFLVTAVSEGTAAESLARFMPSDVASQIRDADHDIKPGEGVRREMTILNVDIRGFTGMVADLEPQDAVAILSQYQHVIVPIVHQHGGVIDKFMGDGIMVTFGASAPMEEHSAAALRCAEDIIRAKSNWKGPAGLIRVNFAVASGPAIYGAVGDGNRLEYTVIGSAVNRSAKLEKLNKSTGSTGVCDQMTFDLAVRQGYIPSDEPVAQTVRVDGEPETIDVILFGMHR